MKFNFGDKCKTNVVIEYTLRCGFDNFPELGYLGVVCIVVGGNILMLRDCLPSLKYNLYLVRRKSCLAASFVRNMIQRMSH